MARHSSPRPPSAPSRFSPPRLSFAPALAPAGLPGTVASTPRTPRYPDVSAFTGGVPETASSPRTATAPPLGRHRTSTSTASTPTASTPRGPAPAEPDRRGPREPRRPSSPRPPRPEHGPSTASALSGRVAVAAVAVGALATAGHSLVDLAAEPSTTELAAGSLALASASAAGNAEAARPAGAAPRAGSGVDAATADVLAVPAAAERGGDGEGQVASLAKGKKRTEEAVARAEAAKAPPFVKPAQGRFTSGFGARWGSSHKGVDIAGPIGTPIQSVADGVVTAAGPASGFGQWVKVRLEDGTETVYGHVNRFFVSEGDTVKAGEEIAEIGNRGQSTGPHLHFEVHTSGGSKINPLPWLAERGISLGAQKD